ncbi:chemotaxis protein CheC [Hydrogenispora ethanolica]|uniref:Chemotaxis protein CheC n=1 Tax=Hydrogenispora ethanolica TaxID=1082276 RepID=A0A4V2QE34_HYDET|nr:chemotaxis protein CheC [Hydrogenispora ethanolica]TCL66567.1 chemotaxis protein CheC [Hydrogenispora ethanolica]
MIRLEDLSHLQLDALKEVGNIGAGHAATALSQILLEKVDMTVPHVSIMPLSQVDQVMGGPEQVVSGIFMRVFGNAPGKIVFLFAEDEAVSLADSVIRSNLGAQTDCDFRESALKEIANIMTGAYLYALTRLTGFNLLPSVPALANDMAGAIINTALLDLGAVGDYALLIQTQFSLISRKINGHFFLVPDPDSLELILNALGVGTGWKK